MAKGKRVYIHICKDERPLNGAYFSLAGPDGHCLGGGYADNSGEVEQCLLALGVDRGVYPADIGDADAIRVGHGVSPQQIDIALALLISH
jgi:hypothetical protein